MKTICRAAAGIFLLIIGVMIGYMYRAVASDPPRAAAAQMSRQAAMKIRRLVTGHSKEGKAIVASDSVIEATRLTTSPGNEFHNLWGADECVIFPDNGEKPVYRDWFAPAGGFRFQQFTFPPDKTPRPAGVDDAAVRAEWDKLAPKLTAALEKGSSGFHRTNTVDLIYVLSGRIVLELDDGVKVNLKAGDTVVQNGTRHAWHNPYDEPCRIIGTQIGAKRRN